jgi:hypothetical protein
MSDYEIEKGLIILDSSGTAPQGKAMGMRANEVAKRVNDNFNPDKLLSNQNEKRMIEDISNDHYDSYWIDIDYVPDNEALLVELEYGKLVIGKVSCYNGKYSTYVSFRIFGASCCFYLPVNDCQDAEHLPKFWKPLPDDNYEGWKYGQEIPSGTEVLGQLKDGQYALVWSTGSSYIANFDFGDVECAIRIPKDGRQALKRWCELPESEHKGIKLTYESEIVEKK